MTGLAAYSPSSPQTLGLRNMFVVPCLSEGTQGNGGMAEADFDRNRIKAAGVPWGE